MVLEDIGKLADDPEYFHLLEKKIRREIASLVPSKMSLRDWIGAIGDLRELNMKSERISGQTTEDPLNAIREMLGKASKAEVV